MKKSFIFILLLFSVGLNAQVISQGFDKSFRPVLSVGLVGSQIDGDTYSGYRKLGYFFGLGINKQLSKRVEIEFDFTFLQKGVRANYKTDSASLNNPNNDFSLIRLNYMEIPFYARIIFKRFKIEGGLAAGFLFINPPKTDENQYGHYDDHNYKSFDYSFLLGAGYKLSKNVFANLRFEYSLVPVRPYDPVLGGVYRGPFAGLFNRGLYNNLLVLSLNYKIPSKQNTTGGTGNVQQ